MTTRIHDLRKPTMASATGLLLAAGLVACNDPADGQMSAAEAIAPGQSENPGATLDDNGITEQVEGRLASDARTQAAGITVETRNGIVTLSGAAPSVEARNAAEELARMVADIKGVNNRIATPNSVEEMADNAETAAMQAGQSIDDAWITTKVKSALLADPQTQGLKIDVDTEQGVVMLSGEIDGPGEQEQAVQVASGIKGVQAVDDTHLVVAGQQE